MKQYKLDEKALNDASLFLAKMGLVAPMPDIQLSPKSSIYVSVPLYREFDNAESIFKAWYSQDFPKGVDGEVLFVVNNRRNPDRETYENNRETYELLSKLSQRHRKDNLGFHIIDKFSGDNALPLDTTIGNVRNLANTPVIRHAYTTGKNGIILSTDGDCFPSENVVARLHYSYSKRANVYGSIERRLEFSPEISAKEQQIIREIFLANLVNDILLEYLTFGEWKHPDTMGGGNTFYSIDNFVNVGGYVNEIPEDLNLAQRLKIHNPRGFVPIEDAHVSGIVRFSDRLDGDGAELQRVRDRAYKISIHAGTVQSHAILRRWLLECVNRGLPYETGRGKLNVRDTFPYLGDENIQRLQRVFTNPASTNDREKYFEVYESAIRVLYDSVKTSPQVSIASFEEMISTTLARDKTFQRLVREISQSHPTSHVPLLALRQYTLIKEEK